MLKLVFDVSIYMEQRVFSDAFYLCRRYVKAAKSVSFDLLFLEIMFLIFKNTVI